MLLFDFMMLIISMAQMQITFCCITNDAEVEKHFRRHFANFFTADRSIIHATKTDQLCAVSSMGNAKSVPLNTTLIGQIL